MDSEPETTDPVRTVRIRRDKVLKCVGDDRDGVPVTWYVAYRGKYGWSACRSDGEWMDEPTDEDVETVPSVYDRVEVVDRADLPDEVPL
jgi:hypothetical protein